MTAVLYGATGYTGRLCARELAGTDTVLAGRREDAVRAVAEPLGLRAAAAPLDGADALLADATVLLNCAGPFPATQAPLLDACLRTGTHYLDIAGEAPEFAAARERGGGAETLVLPGVGFGIVPTDCLAARLRERLPEATALELAFATSGAVSRGTAQTVLTGLHRPGVWRRGGRLEERAPAAARRRVDLGDGPTTVVTNPWRGDIAAVAGYDDVEAFMSVPPPLRALMRHGPRRLLDSRPWQATLGVAIARLPEGPSEGALEKGSSACWARSTAPDGRAEEAVLCGPDAYRFTALAATTAVRKVVAGKAPAGFQTPSSAFGAAFVEEIAGVRVRDREPRRP